MQRLAVTEMVKMDTVKGIRLHYFGCLCLGMIDILSESPLEKPEVIEH